jgi:hypothetical protein
MDIGTVQFKCLQAEHLCATLGEIRKNQFDPVPADRERARLCQRNATK